MIRVHNPGLFTSVQDLGRWGYRDKGVPLSGVMDHYSAKAANALVGNVPEAPVLEITMTGPRLEFEEAGVFALCGADLSPNLSGTEIHNNRSYEVSKGDVLQFGRPKHGYRTYMAVKGGFDTPRVLGSCSWYEPVTPRGHLSKGDLLSVGGSETSEVGQEVVLRDDFFTRRYLKVFKGPEYDWLTDGQKDQLERGIFLVSQENNRMAYRLKEKLYPHKYSMLTSATQPGTVQLTPAGGLIILMKDAQTTGGYPRIFQLTEESIALLSQKRAGDEIVFELMP